MKYYNRLQKFGSGFSKGFSRSSRIGGDIFTTIGKGAVLVGTITGQPEIVAGGVLFQGMGQLEYGLADLSDASREGNLDKGLDAGKKVADNNIFSII